MKERMIKRKRENYHSRMLVDNSGWSWNSKHGTVQSNRTSPWYGYIVRELRYFRGRGCCGDYYILLHIISYYILYHIYNLLTLFQFVNYTIISSEFCKKKEQIKY